MKIYNTEDLTKVYVAEIEALKENVENMEKSIAVIKKFDGKMLNVKLKNAIDEVIKGYVSVEKKSYDINNVRISFTADNRCFIHPQENGYSSCTYASIFDTATFYDLELKDGRIQAEKWIEKINLQIAYYNRELEKMVKNNNKENNDTLTKEREEIKKMIESFNSKLDYVNAKMFSLERTY